MTLMKGTKEVLSLNLVTSILDDGDMAPNVAKLIAWKLPLLVPALILQITGLT